MKIKAHGFNVKLLGCYINNILYSELGTNKIIKEYK